MRIYDSRSFDRPLPGGQAQGVGLSEKVIWQLLQEYATAAGVPGIALHNLLRTSAKDVPSCGRGIGADSDTHRIAISNQRLVGLADGKVSLRWRDSAHKNKRRVMTLRVEEFLRRFFLHVLPPGFVGIRHFGFLANRTEAVAATPVIMDPPAAAGAVPGRVRVAVG